MHLDILSGFSPYIIAAIVGYAVTQTAKAIAYSIKHREIGWRELFQSGGMPSSHTASSTALTVAIGLLDGWGSAVFALAVLFTVVVAYDATHVRRAVGEQGEVLRYIIERDARQEKEIAKLTPDPRDRGGRKFTKPYFSRGHKPTEVLAGLAIGAITGAVIAWVALQ
jgi:acid phosphatase family membrane protein YuiD